MHLAAFAAAGGPAGLRRARCHHASVRRLQCGADRRTARRASSSLRAKVEPSVSAVPLTTKVKEGFRAKTGIVLVNIGTPASTSVEDVREYLRQFLGDHRVVDINPIVKFFVLNLFILPSRPKESAEAYESIWDEERGSPLVFHMEDLAGKLRQRLGEGFHVELGMQFCEPSVYGALRHMRQVGVDRIVVVPMFPQYASSSTGSAVEIIYREAAKVYSTPYLHIVPAFFDHPAYIRSYVDVIRRSIGLRCAKVDYLLMSFHGVPVTHCTRTDETGSHCQRSEGCCSQIVQANRNCYRAQCFETARLLAAALQIDPSKYTVAFQSRLSAAGPEWIRPYTDELIADIAKRGVKRLGVVVPSFTTDCLETLEEIGIRGRDDFLANGGEELTLIPCLNSTDMFADGLIEIIRDSCPLESVV